MSSRLEKKYIIAGVLCLILVIVPQVGAATPKPPTVTPKPTSKATPAPSIRVKPKPVVNKTMTVKQIQAQPFTSKEKPLVKQEKKPVKIVPKKLLHQPKRKKKIKVVRRKVKKPQQGQDLNQQTTHQ